MGKRQVSRNETGAGFFQLTGIKQDLILYTSSLLEGTQNPLKPKKLKETCRVIPTTAL